jgi:hypothetical protein
MRANRQGLDAALILFLKCRGIKALRHRSRGLPTGSRMFFFQNSDSPGGDRAAPGERRWQMEEGNRSYDDPESFLPGNRRVRGYNE